MKKILLTGIAVLLFASCRTYKQYSRPKVNISSQYRDVETPEDTTTLAQLSWQELFTDIHLQALINLGLSQNTNLQVVLLQTEETKAVLQNARLSYLPSLALNPEGSISRYDRNTAKSYNLAALATWETDIFGKATNARRGARETFEGSKDYAQAVRTQLIATIANSYYTLLMLDRQREIGEQTLQSWEKSVKTQEVLKQAGLTNDAAVLQARANRMTLEASVISIRKSITETENSLSALLAQPSQAIERGRLQEATFPKHLSVGIPAQLLSQRPDVRQAERTYAKSFYATNAARAAFYPNLTLSGSLGWTNNGGGIVTNPGSWLMNTLAALTLPLFNKGANIANLKIAKAQQEEALLNFQQSLLDAGKEVNDALAQWQAARQRIELGKKQIYVLQEVVRKTKLLMHNSSTTYLEVLTAQQSLLSAELTQAQDQFDEIQGIINLYHALGGGQ